MAIVKFTIPVLLPSHKDAAKELAIGEFIIFAIFYLLFVCVAHTVDEGLNVGGELNVAGQLESGEWVCGAIAGCAHYYYRIYMPLNISIII